MQDFDKVILSFLMFIREVSMSDFGYAMMMVVFSLGMILVLALSIF
ncbi:hypothetical protein [Conservatibacter flavescens]|nr:hypothetical protein [Conservatibacter flavescens]